MSTAVDAAFAEVVSAYNDAAAEPMHGVCGVCYPIDQSIRPGAVAICGWVVPQEGGFHSPNSASEYRCTTCLTAYHWSCGHHA